MIRLELTPQFPPAASGTLRCVLVVGEPRFAAGQRLTLFYPQTAVREYVRIIDVDCMAIGDVPDAVVRMFLPQADPVRFLQCICQHYGTGFSEYTPVVFYTVDASDPGEGEE